MKSIYKPKFVFLSSMLNLGFKLKIALEAKVHLSSSLNSYFPVQRTVEFKIAYEFSICIYFLRLIKEPYLIK